MAVYVDFLIDYGWKYGPSCHMMADEMEELFLFAESIGLKRSWLDDKAGSLVPHFDLTRGKRELALKKGAIEITDRKTLAEIIDRLRYVFHGEKGRKA